MCEPTTIAWAAVALSAAGAYQDAQNQKAVAGYQASVARNNAATADLQAADAKARGDAAAAEMRRKYAGLLGTQRASLAARGLDITDGSANAVLQDTAYFGEYDERMVRANAAREAWGYKVRATGAASDAAAYQAQSDGINPLMQAGLAAGGTFFSGGQNSIAAKWYSQSRTG